LSELPGVLDAVAEAALRPAADPDPPA